MNDSLAYNIESLKRTKVFFSCDGSIDVNGGKNKDVPSVIGNMEPLTDEVDKIKAAARIMSYYSHVKDIKQPKTTAVNYLKKTTNVILPKHQDNVPKEEVKVLPSHHLSAIESINANKSASDNALIRSNQPAPSALGALGINLSTSMSQAESLYEQRPTWHPPWELMVVISGHLGVVKSISVDPTNQWFATGSADRTIKIWDLARHTLKLTLTGHIANVEAVVASERHPYLFSCGDDHKVMCWDLETNKVIRHYFGHRGGVYTLALHNSLDLLVTGGRDRAVMVWDIRTKKAAYIFQSHIKTVFKVAAQSDYPQVVSGSADMTVRFWDLVAGKCMSILTNHSKAVRSLLLHPTQNVMASAGADAIKKWKLPEGNFIQNFDGAGTQGIIHTLSLNTDNVFIAGTNSGNIDFYDWKSTYRFQTLKTIPQPGSLSSEALIYASDFDRSGSRLITGEGDKTVKIWREVAGATPETHPLNWKPQRRKLQW